MVKNIVIEKPGDYSYTLDKEGSELNITGAFYLKGKEQFNLNLTIIHSAPKTTANINIRAVVDNYAHAIIRGSIIINQNAPQTNSHLSEKILLLSKNAKAQAIPNLEIKNNDVKCSHAAAVGPIDPEQIFYLQSRGIKKTKAKHLIAQGFLS